MKADEIARMTKESEEQPKLDITEIIKDATSEDVIED